MVGHHQNFLKVALGLLRNQRETKETIVMLLLPQMPFRGLWFQLLQKEDSVDLEDSGPGGQAVVNPNLGG